MILWDAGTYETVPPGRKRRMRAKGHLHVRFFGRSCVAGALRADQGDAPQGESTGGIGQGAWLMFKADDETRRPRARHSHGAPGVVKSGKSATRGPRGSARRPRETALALVAASGKSRGELVSASMT